MKNKKSKKKLYIYIGHSYVSFIEKALGNTSDFKYDYIDLKKDGSTNKITTNFDELLVDINKILKGKKVKKRTATLILNSDIFSFRKIIVPNEIDESKTRKWIANEIGKSIHIPYSDPIFDFVVHNTLDDKKEILLFYISEKELSNYYKLFKKLKLKIEKVDSSILAIPKVYYYSKKDIEKEGVLFINAYEDKIISSIFEGVDPIFSTQMKNNTEINLCENIIEVYYKLSNYYKYSLNKGKKEINKSVIISNNKMCKNEFSDLINDHKNIEFLNLKNIKEEYAKLPKEVYIPLGISLA